MIDPFNITNYKMTQNQLEEFLLAAMAVAGKTAKTIFPKVDEFIHGYKHYSLGMTPFEVIKDMIDKNILEDELKRVKLGKYNILVKGYTDIVSLHINVFNCSIEDLEEITGVGMKTSRFFLLHSRENQEIAVLDTHILKYLRDVLKHENIPKSTPVKKDYMRIEDIFIEEAKKHKLSIADFDLMIWKKYATK